MQKANSGTSGTSDKMASSSDSSTSSSSALTNVAPPSALPAFLTSPLPSAVPSTVPPPGPSPPLSSIVPPSQRPGFSPTPPSGPVLTSGTGLSSGANVPAEVPPFPPSNKHPPSPSSALADHGMVSQSFESPQPYYAPTSNSTDPVTSQPQPPCSESSANASASVDIGSPGIVVPTKKNEGPGWFGWIRGTVSNVGHRVAERAKTSMDSMITTLDPQMKEFIHSGGDMDIIVASDKEVKVGAMREAFQMMFGKATVSGMKAEAQGVAAQPVGFEAALNSAEGRINFIRSSGQIHPQQPIVAVENFIVEFHSDCWFDLGLLLLDDPGEDILLQTYTQVTPVPPGFVNQARSATPEDYPYKDSGFAVTVGQIASQSLQVHHTMWQESLTGVSRREALVLAGRTLAGLYRSRLPSYH